MPAFDTTLNDMEIIAVLTYIKSEWSAKKRAIQNQIQQDSISATVIYNAG